MGLVESTEVAVIINPKQISGTWWDIAGYPTTGCYMTKVDINKPSTKAKLSCISDAGTTTSITDVVITYPSKNRIDLTFARNGEMITYEVAVLHYNTKGYMIISSIGLGDIRILSRTDKISKDLVSEILKVLKALDINTNKIIIDRRVVV